MTEREKRERLMAELDGIRTIVATPHMRYDTFPNTAEGIRKAHASLSARLEREAVSVRLILGAEVHLAPDMADRFRSGDLITYGGVGKFLLLELPYQQFPARVEEMVFQFRLLGVTPVLAHPERIAFFLDDSTRLADRAREAGVKVELKSWQGMTHVWHNNGPDLPEGREAVAHIAAFIAKLLD